MLGRSEKVCDGEMAPSALYGRDICVRFGELAALENVSIRVLKGAVVGLIGPNGAGKTTLINVLTGFQRANAGRILLAENDITNFPAHRIAQAGVARTFQSARLFADLTVSENVEASAVGKMSSRRAA